MTFVWVWSPLGVNRAWATPRLVSFKDSILIFQQQSCHFYMAVNNNDDFISIPIYRDGISIKALQLTKIIIKKKPNVVNRKKVD